MPETTRKRMGTLQAGFRVCLCAVLFTLVMALPSCTRTPAGQIERVLRQCAEVSKKASAYRDNPSAAAGYVADGFQSIDVTACPPEFRVAFQQHILAWREAQSAIAGNSLGMNFLEGLLGGATGNYSQMGSAQAGESQATAEINASYRQLTSIAAYYGARIPRSVVE